MRSHGKHTRRGLGALIAAGLALGSAAAYAAPIADDNHQLTITDDIQTWRMNGGYLNLTHANGDSEASTSGNTIEVNSRDFNMTDECDDSGHNDARSRPQPHHADRGHAHACLWRTHPCDEYARRCRLLHGE